MWSTSCFVRSIRAKNRNTFITVVFLGCVIITVLLAYTAFGEESKDNQTLKLVHIVFRHGDRTPSMTYENDPYKNHNYWSIGWGELTNKGKQQLYELGKTLKKKYRNFLSNLYSGDEVEMQSSYAGRCQMSAMTLLAGMFPPHGEQVWNPDLLWQPIPINTVPRNMDNIIAAKADCPMFTAEKLKSDEILSLEVKEEHESLFKYLTEHTGQPINNISDIELLYNTLFIENENNLILPQWTKTVFPEPMKRLAYLNLASFTQTETLIRLQAGPMLNEWVKHMRRVSSGDNGVSKLYLYSSHDLTLVNCLRALRIKEPILPLFGAALVVELHYEHLNYFIKVLYYKSSSSEEPVALTIPGCEVPCSLEKFFQIANSVVPTNWSKECMISS